GACDAALLRNTALNSCPGPRPLIASLAAVALELFTRRLPRALLVLLLLSVLSFALIGAAELPLQERYALPTTVLLAVFFGHLVTGWRGLPRARLRVAWMLCAAVAAGFVVADAPRQRHPFA